MKVFSKLFGGETKGKAPIGVPKADVPTWPSSEEREYYLDLLDSLRYAKTGVQAEIARRIGCKRQYVCQIFNAPDPFGTTGYKARAVWETLPNVLKEDKSFLEAKPMLEALEAGHDIELRTNDTDFVKFLNRKIKQFGFKLQVSCKPEKGKNISIYLYQHEKSGETE